ncbi:MAG: biotin-dependent carboxyltransferase [Acidobacteria bacterium]|nr:MAG: biotin-dependent carboxyltransferase [Acidobacteriota bacterium]
MTDVKIIRVLDGGLFTTVQDSGRYGFQRYGVPVSGAMDRGALQAANALVGNDGSAAALEMTLLGPRLEFLASATIALAGADLGAVVGNVPTPAWESVTVPAGAILSFTGARDGIRGYLAVAGGFDVPVVLGSRSTYTRSRLGGLDGRQLKAGDLLRVLGVHPVADLVGAGFGGRAGAVRRVPPALRPEYGHRHVLRVVLGPQDDRFTSEGVATLLSSTYSVTPQSDRMGYRLQGPKIEHTAGPDIVSDGSPLGAVQVAGDGMPIVLMADRGTAGGYTKVATVVSLDVWRLAQAAAGDEVRFEAITVEAAHRAVREHEQWIGQVRGAAATSDGARARRAAAAVAAVASYLIRE